MTTYTVRPLNRPVDADVAVPGSKSITNRALLLAALVNGESVLENALFSEDSHWFSESLRRMGIVVWEDAAHATMTVRGEGGTFPEKTADCFVGNSGTTARFMVAAAALGRGDYRFDGVPRMRQRPIAPLLDALRPLGTRFSFEADADCFPLIVHGEGLRGGETTLDAAASSQYLTGLLMAAPYAEGDVTIRLAGELVSEPYIDMTIRMMAQFGVQVSMGKGVFMTRTGGRYRAQRYIIEPDASNATYFFAAAALCGGRVRVPNLPALSLQGDVGFVDVLAQMGCAVTKTAEYIEVQGTGTLHGVDVDMNAISDTAQTLAAIAPFADSPVRIRNIGHIRHKETDRIHAAVNELKRLGVDAEEFSDGLIIQPSVVHPAEVQTYDDHRMAMAFSVIGLRAEGITIANPECTAKTFPDFFQRFESLYT